MDKCFECVEYLDETERVVEGENITVAQCCYMQSLYRDKPSTYTEVEKRSETCRKFCRGIPESITDKPDGWPLGIPRERAMLIKKIVMECGLSCVNTAKIVGMSASTVSAIRRGTTWFNVTEGSGTVGDFKEVLSEFGLELDERGRVVPSDKDSVVDDIEDELRALDVICGQGGRNER